MILIMESFQVTDQDPDHLATKEDRLLLIEALITIEMGTEKAEIEVAEKVTEEVEISRPTHHPDTSMSYLLEGYITQFMLMTSSHCLRNMQSLFRPVLK